MNCQLTDILTEGIGGCKELSVGGLQSIYLFPFGDLYDYAYTDNNTSFITNYRQLSVGVDLQTNKQSSSFSESLLRDNVNVFEQTLSTVIPKLSESKRGALEALLEYPLTAIAKDRNGKCWILGQDSPLKMDVYTATSGTSDSSSEYSIVLSGMHRSQIRQIACPDIFCGFSVNDSYLFNSRYSIRDFLLLSPTDDYVLEIQVGAITVDGNLIDFQPSLWSTDPQQYIADAAKVQAVLGAYGNVEELSFDGTDVFLRLSSTTVALPLISVNANQFPAVMSRFLNLSIVGGITQLGSTVTVDDEAGTIYSGPFGAVISPSTADLYGNTNDAYINLDYYPNGQTFTISANSNCGSTTRQITVVNPNDCLAEFTLSCERGYHYTLEYRKPEGEFEFVYTQMYYNGITTTIFPTFAEWTNDFAIFEQAVIDGLSLNTYVDPASIVVTDGPFIVTIEFDGTADDADAFLLNWRTTLQKNSDFKNTVGIFKTFANNDANIAVNSYRGSFSGDYGQYPTSVTGDFEVANTPNAANTTNDLAISLDLLAEDDPYEAIISSALCPDASYEFQTKTCFKGLEREIEGTYARFVFNLLEFSYNDLGKGFYFETNQGNIYFYTTSAITPITLDQIGVAIEQQLSTQFRVLNVQYDYFIHQFNIEVEILDPSLDVVALWAIEENRTALVNDELNVIRYTVNPVIHPAIQATIDFPTNCGNWVHSYGVMRGALDDYKWSKVYPAAFINNVGGSNLFEVTLRDNTILDGQYDLTFHTAYPTSSNEVDRLTIVQPTTTGSIDIQANPDYLNITHIALSNTAGAYVVMEWNSTQSNITIDIESTIPLRSYWGHRSDFRVLADKMFNHQATIEIDSSVCPEWFPNPEFWWNPYRSNINTDTTYRPSVETLRVTEGSNLARYTGSSLNVGDVLRIDNTDHYYIITDIDLPNVYLHCKYRDTSNINASFDYIVYQNLPDSGTAGFIAQQPNVAESPIMVYNGVGIGKGLNPKGAEYFAFNNNFSQTYTVAAVIKNTNAASLQTIFGQIRSAAGNAYERLQFNGPTLTMTMSITDNSGTNASSSTAVNLNDPLIVVASFDDGTGTITIAVNGVESFLTGTFTTFGQITNAILFAGYDGLSIEDEWTGVCEEFLVDDETTRPERIVLEGFLAWRHNLASVLPNGHKFKTQRPTVQNVDDFLN